MRCYFISLLACAFILALTGCANTPAPEPLRDVVLAPVKDTVVIPEETYRECDLLPLLEERAYSQVQLLDFMQTLLTPVADCRARKADQTRTMRRAFNSK